jgi:hypothetical protein
MATAETQQTQQLAPQAQSAPVQEKSNLDNHRAVSTPEDEGFLLFFCALFRSCF